MKDAFADTAYWIAIFRPGDPWAVAALKARRQLGEVGVVTVDDVLVEFLAAVSAGGPSIRLRAVQFVRLLLERPDVEVIPHSGRLFVPGSISTSNGTTNITASPTALP